MKNKMQVIMPDSEFKFKKPYEMGRFLEELNALAKSILDFLEIQTKRTDDDYDLVAEINHQIQRYKSAEENYQRLLKATPELEHKKQQAEEMEAKLAKYNELGNKIKDYQDLIMEIDEKHSANLEIYKTHLEVNNNLIAKMKKYGDVDPKEDIQKLSEEISIKLKEFDHLLEELIKVRDKLAIHELDESWRNRLGANPTFNV